MTKIAEILILLEQLAPLAYQEDYDNSGLIIGDKEQEVSNVLLSLDCTEEVLAEAIQKNCNVVLCHHPIIFKGLKKINGANYVEKTVIKAIKNNIAIIAWHTNLDNVLINGVNQKIAEKLGLQNCKILNAKPNTLLKLVAYVPNEYVAGVLNALFLADCGAIGAYENCSFSVTGQGTFKGKVGANPFIGKVGELKTQPEQRIEVLVPIPAQRKALEALKKAHPYQEVAYEFYPISNYNQQIGSGIIGNLHVPMKQQNFLKMVKEIFNLKVIKYTNCTKEMIFTISVCGGSGSFLIKNAKAKGADAFLTADLKYHDFFDAEKQLLLCDIGHFESEISTLEIFSKVLTENFANFATLFATTNTNPVNYYI